MKISLSCRVIVEPAKPTPLSRNSPPISSTSPTALKSLPIFPPLIITVPAAANLGPMFPPLIFTVLPEEATKSGPTFPPLIFAVPKVLKRKPTLPPLIFAVLPEKARKSFPMLPPLILTKTLVLEPSDSPALKLLPTIPLSKTLRVVFEPINSEFPMTTGGASITVCCAAAGKAQDIAARSPAVVTDGYTDRLGWETRVDIT